MENNNTYRGIGLTGIAAIWGLITQALAWGGVIVWPWYAIWGPLLLMLAVDLVVVLVVFVVALVIAALGG